MKMMLNAIVALAALFLASSVRAEEWSYTGYYPYVYTPTTDSWFYAPDSAPLVWDYTAGDWVANPLGGNVFDIRETFNQCLRTIKLSVPDGYDPIAITINYSGFRTGQYEVTSVSHAIDYDYVINAQAGTCQLFGEWDESVDFGESKAMAFSLFLDFETATTGTYTFLGDVGLEAEDAVTQVSNFSGSFTIGPME